MSIRNFCIRIIADCIYLIRYRTLNTGNVRFLVFTGTSGKTLARTATAYALRKAGFRVISPPYGYTNELGVVLAALGVETLSLLSLEGIQRVIQSNPPSDAYVCIELGADWRLDIPWFLKRFKPYGVFITNTSIQEWTRPLENIWSDKQRLVRHIPQDGFLCWSKQNESVEKIRTMGVPEHKYCTLDFTVSAGKMEFLYESQNAKYHFSSPSSALTPYTEAFGCAIACMEIMKKIPLLSKDFFAGYQASKNRFSYQTLTGGSVLVSDTYKSVPQCSKYVLEFALALPAKKHIAVVSAMHPLWMNKTIHYRNLSSTLKHFDKIYFIGPHQIYNLIKRYVPKIERTDEVSFKDLAVVLQENASTETVLVIKTAGRYHAESLVEMLLV